MPEYLAPGVYVEERSFRSKSIEGVGTSTTAFVGATRYGPLEGEPELMTSFSQFERIYGGLDPLDYGTTVHNYLAHAVRAFFDNGGSRLYIARAFTPPVGDTTFVARAAIPAPVRQIEDANNATAGATSRTLGALGEAAAAIQDVQAGALVVLQYAVAQVLANLDATPPPDLNYDYGAGDDIGTQLAAFIGAVPAGAERDALDATVATFQNTINTADETLKSSRTRLTSVTNAMTTVSGARSAGVTTGNNAVIAGQAPQPGNLVPATTTVNNAATTVTTLANGAQPNEGLEALSLVADTALGALTDDVTAEAAVAALDALSTNVQAVVDAAVVTPNTNASTLIQSLANLATIEARISEANATAFWRARFPGAAGNMSIEVWGRLAEDVLTERENEPAINQVRSGDLVVIRRGGTAPIYTANRANGVWSFTDSAGTNLPLASLNPAADEVLPMSISVELTMPGRFPLTQFWDGLTISNLAERNRDSITRVFNVEISNRMQELETPVTITPADEDDDIDDLNLALLASNLINLADWAENLGQTPPVRVHNHTFQLAGGSDGLSPDAESYNGRIGENSEKSGLAALEDLEEISIIAAPGYSRDWGTRRADILTISNHLINHCEKMRYRVAILDSPDGLSLSGVREYRALLDNTRAALYYPWVRVLDPITRQEINLPPSGFMAGIYARNDVENGVHKAPANEVVRGAIGMETLINKAQQDVLNPLGINCIRFFEGRGIRIWGARTISSDPEWKYLNIRRYFAYLEASIDISTQWAVFEPNGEVLWANIRRTVSDFLYNEWKEEHLAGTKPNQAFFVQCDRTTMTQNDLDNGRLICLIGVAPLYPAEFVIFRIGQWTADAT